MEWYYKILLQILGCNIKNLNLSHFIAGTIFSTILFSHTNTFLWPNTVRFEHSPGSGDKNVSTNPCRWSVWDCWPDTGPRGEWVPPCPVWPWPWAWRRCPCTGGWGSGRTDTPAPPVWPRTPAGTSPTAWQPSQCSVQVYNGHQTLRCTSERSMIML